MTRCRQAPRSTVSGMVEAQAAAPLTAVAAVDAEERGSDRILTIPNLISTLRILAVPVFAHAVVVERSPYTINIVLVVIGVSDFLDGWTARHLHQVSELGKVLDPIGDRLALGVALTLYLYKGWIPLWLGVALIAREAI